jgi:hypothetical protein
VVVAVVHSQTHQQLLLDQVALADQVVAVAVMQLQENQEDQELQVKELLVVVEQLTKIGMLPAAAVAAQVVLVETQLLVTVLQIQV